MNPPIFAMLSVMVISWSFYYVLDERLITELGSPCLAGALLRLGTFFIMTAVLLLSKRMKWRFPCRECFLRTLAVAVTAFAFDFLINIGLKYSTASSGSALLKTEILFVFILDAVMRKKFLSAADYLFSGLMMIGAILIVMKEAGRSGIDGWSLLFIISALLNSVCAIQIKKLQEKYPINSYQIAYFNNVVSLVLYAVATALFARSGAASCFNRLNHFEWLLCVLCQTLLMLTYYRALRVAEVWVVKMVQLVIPVLTLLIQVCLYKERVSPLQTSGIALLLASGCALNIKNYKRRERP